MHKPLIVMVCLLIAAPAISEELSPIAIEQEMEILTERDVSVDPFEMNDFDFDRIESFIEHNPNSFVLEPPSKLMIWLRIIGSPILMGYLETKQKVVQFIYACYARILHRKTVS